MERLEAKQINGKTYYYYSKWGWKNGKCRRLWQKYLGSLEKIVRAVDGGPAPLFAEVFQWGLPMALWKECDLAQVITEIDQLCPKRKQGLGVGQYIAIAALNRALSACSKRSIWEWFSQTALVRKFTEASASSLSSQRFWDHMDRIKQEDTKQIWKNLMKGVVAREQIDLSSISYDGTNFYTFIDTFNTRCQIAKRGKNKQGRGNLRQVSYALFCGADGSLPLYYDVYDGNRSDARQFQEIIKRFHLFFNDLTDSQAQRPEITVIFDKGNNSAGNFGLLDDLGLHFVGSLKLDEHKDLMAVSNDDKRFDGFEDEGLATTKAFRTLRMVGGKQRTLVVTYNQNLFHAQWLTVQADIEKAFNQLQALQQRLADRANGLVSGGRAPTRHSVEKQCKKSLSRQHLHKIINIEIQELDNRLLKLDYSLDEQAMHELANTYLGKTILVTTRNEWDNARIIRAYRSQSQIENVFKEMKDRVIGNWWPLQHWTDSKIQVHGLYCSIALLLRALMMRRLRNKKIRLSMKRVYTELGKIRQVVNIFPKKRGQKQAKQQLVFTEITDTQKKLLTALEIDPTIPGLG